ncbi:MAG: methyltransferase family protein [Limisphaerales bacterium]
MVCGRLIIACWISFVLYWAINARSVKAAAERQSWTGMLAHRLPILAGGVLLFWPAFPGRLGRELIPHAVLLQAPGVLICVLGLCAAVWSRKVLADNWSSLVVFKEKHVLVERGPYRFVRHPIYTSILVMCLGTALVSNRVAALPALVFYFAGFWIKLKQEEKLLLRHFPDAYPAYQARVKALVPCVF